MIAAANFSPASLIFKACRLFVSRGLMERIWNWYHSAADMKHSRKAAKAGAAHTNTRIQIHKKNKDVLPFFVPLHIMDIQLQAARPV